MVDTLVLGTSAKAWEFESLHAHLFISREQNMRINQISTCTNYNNKNYANRRNFAGTVNYREVNHIFTKFPNRLVKNISATSDDLQKFSALTDRLTAKMEKFSDSTILNFKMKTLKEYEAFIENPFSHYKQLLPNIKFSEQDNPLTDLDVLEKFVKDVENTNQFDVELKFTQMRLEYVPRDEFKPKI